jgi:hypothetical protein
MSLQHLSMKESQRAYLPRSTNKRQERHDTQHIFFLDHRADVSFLLPSKKFCFSPSNGAAVDRAIFIFLSEKLGKFVVHALQKYRNIVMNFCLFIILSFFLFDEIKHSLVSRLSYEKQS